MTRMKKYIFTIIVCLVAISAKTQLKVEYSAGYGNYKMTDLSNEFTQMRDLLIDKYPFDLAIVDNFPGSVTNSVALSYLLKKHEIGLNFTYLTTGSKMVYSDYSGEIENKLTLNAFRLGLLYRYHFYNISIKENLALSFWGELSPALTLSDIKIKGHIKTDNESLELDNASRINSNLTGFSLLPQLGVNLDLPLNLGVHLSAGYDFEMGTKLKKEDKDVKVDWSGFRISAGVSYKLPF